MPKDRQLPSTPPLLPYKPSETQTCTDTFYRFISEYDKIVGLFLFIVTLASKADEVRKIAAAALKKTDEPDEPIDNSILKRVQTFSTQLSRTLVTDMANNFLCYLSEILQDVLKKRHEVLRSGEKLTTEEVLQFTRISDIIAFVADRKINELSYGSLKQMNEFIADRLGVQMFKDDKERMLLTILVELRNIHAHNRGIVHDLFLNRIGCDRYEDFHFKLGNRYHVDFNRFVKLSRNAIAIALHLDEMLAKKFRLKRSHYKKRLAKERASEQR